jgi:hypothetical protein
MSSLAIQTNASLQPVSPIPGGKIGASGPSFPEALQAVQPDSPPTGLEPLDQWSQNFRFNFPDNYPSDLRQKLETTWAGLKTNKDRYNFENMYEGIFYQSGSPGDHNNWDSNWRSTLKTFLQANAGIGRTTTLDEQASRTRVLDLARQLLA